MNVLTLSTLYPKTYNAVDGIFVHQHVLHLRKYGCGGVVICPIPWASKHLPLGKKWELYTSVPLKEKFDDIEVYYPKYFRPPGRWFRPLAGLSMFLGLRNLVHHLVSTVKIDLIHAHILLPDGSAAVRLAKTLNIPSVCTSWGSDIHTTPFENARTLSATKHVLQTADRIITVSEDLKRIATKRLKVSNEIRVVYTGVDIDRFQGNSSQKARQQLQLETETPLVLFIGHLLKLKGVLDLIWAFAEVVKSSSVKLALIGEGAEQHQVVELIKQLNLTKHVSVVGRKSYAEIPKWLNAADMLVLPSHGEGLPNVVLEAMASKRAVIASNIGGIPELVVGGVTGLLVPPREPAILAKAIQSLITDPIRCREMGARGRERAVQEFTWERHASAMISIYDEIIDGQVTS